MRENTRKAKTFFTLPVDTGCSLKDLPGAMDDNDGLRERERERESHGNPCGLDNLIMTHEQKIIQKYEYERKMNVIFEPFDIK